MYPEINISLNILEYCSLGGPNPGNRGPEYIDIAVKYSVKYTKLNFGGSLTFTSLSFIDPVQVLVVFEAGSCVLYIPVCHEEVTVLFSPSGSMQGNKMENAKEALLLFLKSLPAECSFNIVSFGSSHKCLFSG